MCLFFKELWIFFQYYRCIIIIPASVSPTNKTHQMMWSSDIGIMRGSQTWIWSHIITWVIHHAPALIISIWYYHTDTHHHSDLINELLSHHHHNDHHHNPIINELYYTLNLTMQYQRHNNVPPNLLIYYYFLEDL